MALLSRNCSDISSRSAAPSSSTRSASPSSQAIGWHCSCRPRRPTRSRLPGNSPMISLVPTMIFACFGRNFNATLAEPVVCELVASALGDGDHGVFDGCAFAAVFLAPQIPLKRRSTEEILIFFVILKFLPEIAMIVEETIKHVSLPFGFFCFALTLNLSINGFMFCVQCVFLKILEIGHKLFNGLKLLLFDITGTVNSGIGLLIPALFVGGFEPCHHHRMTLSASIFCLKRNTRFFTDDRYCHCLLSFLAISLKSQAVSQ